MWSPWTRQLGYLLWCNNTWSDRGLISQFVKRRQCCNAVWSHRQQDLWGAHTVVCTVILLFTGIRSHLVIFFFFFFTPEELTSSLSVNLLGKFDSFLPGRYPWYICFSSAVQITRYIPLYLFIPDFWGWGGGKPEVVIPFESSQLEMGYQSNGPNLWAEKENLHSVSPVWSLKPPKVMAWEGGGKLCPRGEQLGLVCCPSMVQKGCRSSWVSWIRTTEVLCS